MLHIEFGKYSYDKDKIYTTKLDIDIILYLPFMLWDINQLIQQRREELENFKLDLVERVDITKDVITGMGELNQ